MKWHVACPIVSHTHESGVTSGWRVRTRIVARSHSMVELCAWMELHSPPRL